MSLIYEKEKDEDEEKKEEDEDDDEGGFDILRAFGIFTSQKFVTVLVILWRTFLDDSLLG